MQELAVRDGLVSRCVVSVQLFEHGNSTPSLPHHIHVCLQRMQVSAGGQRLVDCSLKVNTLEQVSDIPVLRAIAIPYHTMPCQSSHTSFLLCVSAREGARPSTAGSRSRVHCSQVLAGRSQGRTVRRGTAASTGEHLLYSCP